MSSTMETLNEDEEEYSWKEVKLPLLVPVVSEPELERETGERRRGRDIVIAVDHGPNSKHAFDWAVLHFCRLADTIHLIHVVSSVQNQIVYETSRLLMEKLAVEAFQVAMVKTVARITEGDIGKAICKEVERVKPVALVMGTRGRSLIKSVLQGSVSEYCFHNCKAAPVIIVPGKGKSISLRLISIIKLMTCLLYLKFPFKYFTLQKQERNLCSRGKLLNIHWIDGWSFEFTREIIAASIEGSPDRNWGLSIDWSFCYGPSSCSGNWKSPKYPAWEDKIPALHGYIMQINITGGLISRAITDAFKSFNYRIKGWS
ncbi:hypothetical protein ACLOJK_032682 [Asimina triloba]